MSSEKTLKDILFDLKLQLDQLDKKLFELSELQEKRNNIQNTLTFLQKQYSIPNNLTTSEQDANNYYSHMSCSDASYEYLKEQKRVCSTREIANVIYSRGVKISPDSLISSTSVALRRLCEQNKIKRVKKGFWCLVEEIIDASNEHEKL